MFVNKAAHNDELMNQAVLPSQVEMADKIYRADRKIGRTHVFEVQWTFGFNEY